MMCLNRHEHENVAKCNNKYINLLHRIWMEILCTQL